jgi:hypothetical protein
MAVATGLAVKRWLAGRIDGGLLSVCSRSNLSILPRLPCKKYTFCHTRRFSIFNTDLKSSRREFFKSGLLFENGQVFQKLFP